jgi:hypothetical protein
MSLNLYSWNPIGQNILSDLRLNISTISPIIDDSVITITFDKLILSMNASCEVLHFTKCVLDIGAKSITLSLPIGSP